MSINLSKAFHIDITEFLRGLYAYSTMNTLGNIKNPEQVTDSLKENPEKIKVIK